MGHIELPLIFQNGMVLQCKRPICIWGTAQGCAQITVALAGQSACTAVKAGRWQVYLPPMPAGTGYTLTVSAGNACLTYRDVALGEVWLASGQSNMEFLLRDDAEAVEAAKTNHPYIRCFEVPKRSYIGQENDQDFSGVGCWRYAQGSESLYFSAVGFYFATRLWAQLKVPVGIINCTWGGTSASAFTARAYLTGPLARFTEKADAVQADMDYETGLQGYRAMQKQLAEMPISMATVNAAPLIATEEMKAFMEKMDCYRLAAFSPFRPCGLYETMLKTIAPYTVSGVLWYQGESDEPNTDLYEALMGAMIRCWRDLWHEELPFLLVQLASFEFMMEPLDFVPIRAIQQALCNTLSRVWMVCAMDAGLQYDIHPKNKRPVGERLALQAISKIYGYSILSDSPSVWHCSRNENTVTVVFDHCGDGLTCAGTTPQTFDISADGVPVSDFSVQVHENQIRITSLQFAAATKVAVDFAQRPYCIDNIYNSANLPVLPFTCTL